MAVVASPGRLVLGAVAAWRPVAGALARAVECRSPPTARGQPRNGAVAAIGRHCVPPEGTQTPVQMAMAASAAPLWLRARASETACAPTAISRTLARMATAALSVTTQALTMVGGR